MNESKIDYIKSKRQPFAWGDLIVLIVAVALTVTLAFTLTGEKGSGVEIICDGTRTVLPLGEDKRLNVGGHLTVTINGGKVSVTESDCRNLVCVRTGEISRIGESIVCAQYRVVITVIGFDGTAGTVGQG